MDHNENQPQNQAEAGTIFQTTVDNNPSQSMQPEEVSAEVQSPENVTGGPPPDYFSELPPVYEQKSNKWVFIIGAIVFFIVIFGLFYYFFLKDRLSNSNPPISDQPVTLTWWGLWETAEVYESVIQEYQKRNSNITVVYEQVSKEQYRERLIARSQTGNGPDIFSFHNTWLPEIGEVSAPLPAEIMSGAEFEKTFYPIHSSDLKIGENYYGIPLSIDGLVLIYNEKLFRQAGIVAPPALWVGASDDVLSTASKLTVLDSNSTVITSGIAMGTADNVEYFSELFGVLLTLNGGSLDGLNENPATEALELYRSFEEDNLWNQSMPNSISAFTQGRVAMIVAPSWQILSIKAQNPNLELNVAPLPKGLSNNRVSIATYWAEGVNKYSAHQLEAWNFLKFLTEQESLQSIYDAQSQTRLFGNAYSRNDMADLLVNNKYLESVVQQAQNDEYISLPLANRTYDAGLNDEIVAYLKNAVNDTLNGVDYGRALETAHMGIQQVKERYVVE